MIEQVPGVERTCPDCIARERGEAIWQGVRYPFHYLPHLLGDTEAVPEGVSVTGCYYFALVRSVSRCRSMTEQPNQEVVVKTLALN